MAVAPKRETETAMQWWSQLTATNIGHSKGYVRCKEATNHNHDTFGDNCISLQCAHGTAYETACKRGQAYSNEYHRCDYPDSVPDCDSESVVGFKCPTEYELPPNAVARRYAQLHLAIFLS